MRARTFGFALVAVLIGYMVATQSEVVGVVLMVLGAMWLWLSARRWGVRR